MLGKRKKRSNFLKLFFGGGKRPKRLSNRKKEVRDFETLIRSGTTRQRPQKSNKPLQFVIQKTGPSDNNKHPSPTPIHRQVINPNNPFLRRPKKGQKSGHR